MACPLRDIIGILQHGFPFSPRGHTLSPLLPHVKHIFVEQNACPVRGHYFHYVCELDSEEYGYSGWQYGVTGKASMRTILPHYSLAQGYALTDPRFVLIPRFPHLARP